METATMEQVTLSRLSILVLCGAAIGILWLCGIASIGSGSRDTGYRLIWASAVVFCLGWLTWWSQLL